MYEEKDEQAEESSSLMNQCCVWSSVEGVRAGGLWRIAAAEAGGASLLVLLTCLGPCSAPAPLAPLHSALAAGFVVAVVVQCFDHISGAHVNPAVTLAAVVTGRVSWRRGAVSALAQVAGATAGAVLSGLLATGTSAGVSACVTRPHAGLGVGRAVLVESVLSAALALANCAAWDPRTVAHTDSWPLRVGFIVASLSLAGGELTGASMNPVRSLAPAFWSGHWQDQWVYLVGPVCGAAVAAVLYRAAWGPALPAAGAGPGARARGPLAAHAHASPPPVTC